MKTVIAKIKNWYNGGPLPTRQNIPGGGVICRMPDSFEPSISAKIVRGFITFWHRHFKFIIKTLISIIGIVVTASGVFVTYLIYRYK